MVKGLDNLEFFEQSGRRAESAWASCGWRSGQTPAGPLWGKGNYAGPRSRTVHTGPHGQPARQGSGRAPVPCSGGDPGPGPQPAPAFLWGRKAPAIATVVSPAPVEAGLRAPCRRQWELQRQLSPPGEGTPRAVSPPDTVVGEPQLSILFEGDTETQSA